MGLRRRKAAPMAGTTRTQRGGTQFSPAFIDAVGACENVDAFVALMEQRGIWLNVNAATDVYQHLRSLSGALIDDESLSGVRGGVTMGPGALDEPLQAALQQLSEQLGSISF